MSDFNHKACSYLDWRIYQLENTIRESEYELSLLKIMKRREVEMLYVERSITEPEHDNETVNVGKLRSIFEEQRP